MTEPRPHDTPAAEHAARPSAEVLADLAERLAPDMTYRSGRILGSMISAPHPLGVDVLARFAEKNVGDPGLFPATAQLERETIAQLGGWLGLPEAVGHIVSGGNEANILALWAARAQARAQGRPQARRVLVPAHAHVSYDKAARLLDLELVKLPVDDRFRLDTRAARRAVDEHTLALVGVAGTTDLGCVDPIARLSDIAVKRDVHLHVDAAFGGYVLPFLAELERPSPRFDFSLPGVSTLTIDPHKMGLAPQPAGGLLFRDAELAAGITLDIGYLAGGKTTQATLTGTRPGAAVLAVWALLQHLGRDGYAAIVRECMQATDDFVARITDMAGVDVITPPLMNIVGIRPRDVSCAVAARRLREAGWALSEFPTHLRVVLSPHVTGAVVDAFLDDLTRCIRRDAAATAG